MKTHTVLIVLLCAGMLLAFWFVKRDHGEGDFEGGSAVSASHEEQEVGLPREGQGTTPIPASELPGASSSRNPVHQQPATLSIEVRDLADQGLAPEDSRPHLEPAEVLHGMRYVGSGVSSLHTWEATVEAQRQVAVSLQNTSLSRDIVTKSLETPQPGEDLVVALEIGLEGRIEAGPFWVRFVAEKSGAALPGVKAELYASAGRAKNWERSSEHSGWLASESEGLIKLDAKLSRDAFLGVISDGYSPALVPLVGRHATAENALEVRLRSSAKLSGTIESSEGEDLESLTATVSTPFDRLVYPTNAAWMISASGFRKTAPVASDGRFTLSDLPSGVYLKLEIHRRDGIAQYAESIMLAPAEDLAVTYVLARDQGILGRVLDEQGSPMVGEKVKASLFSGDVPKVTYDKRYLRGSLGITKVSVTNGEGEYQLLGLQAGQWMVEVERSTESAPDYVKTWERVSVAPHGGLRTHDIHLEQGQYIRGHVLDGEGRPAAGARLLGFWQKQFPTTYATVSGEGRFEIGPVRKGEYLIGVAEGNGFLESEDVVAYAGVEDLELRVERAGLMRVRIHDPTSETYHMGEIRIFESDGETPRQYVAWKFVYEEDEAPGLVVDFLASGRAYDVFASTKSGLVGLAVRVEATPEKTREAAAVGVEVGTGKELLVRNSALEAKAYRILQEGMLVAHGALEPAQQHVHFLLPRPGVVLWESNGERRESKLEAISPGAVEEVTID